MRNKILVWCREQALLPSGAHVVCAVSGGADSVAMLHALCALRAELGITVSAAHFNRRLRGAESDRDEAFVRALCQTLGVSLSVSGADAERRAHHHAAQPRVGVPFGFGKIRDLFGRCAAARSLLRRGDLLKKEENKA